MSILVCGFMVVRKPEANFDELGRGAYPRKAPRLSNIYYGGIDRMPWFDVEEDYYSSRLPEPVTILLNDLRRHDCDFSGIRVCDSLDNATSLLSYSNRGVVQNEMISLRSPLLGKLKGVQPLRLDECEFLGFDLLLPGHGSLIRDGIFDRPDQFEEFVGLVNHAGLFSSLEAVRKYVRVYKVVASAGLVEELPSDEVVFEPIEVWRVSAADRSAPM